MCWAPRSGWTVGWPEEDQKKSPGCRECGRAGERTRRWIRGAGGVGARRYWNPRDAEHRILSLLSRERWTNLRRGREERAPEPRCLRSTGALLLGRLGPPPHVDEAVCLCAERVTGKCHKGEMERQRKANVEHVFGPRGQEGCSAGLRPGSPPPPPPRREEEHGNAHVRDRGLQSPRPSTAPPPWSPPYGEEETVAVTSTAPSLGRKGRVQPATAEAKPCEGGRDVGAPRCPARLLGSPARTRPGRGLGAPPPSWLALQGPRRRQVERVLSRGAGREPETRAPWAPRGSTRGSSLPTALRLHEEEKCTGKPSDPSKVTQPGKVVGPQGWERWGQRGMTNSCPRSERCRGRTRPAGGLLPDPEGQGRGRAGVRTREDQ